MTSLNVAMLAGEPSGDKLGGALLDGLNRLGEVKAFGVGGPIMAAKGHKSLFPMNELAIMGLVEILPKIPLLLRRIKQTAAEIIKQKPEVIITIDSPDFCFRVVKKVKKELPDIKVVHYVAPSVWAWRPERAAKMAQYVDHVLALLPFEPPYMTAEGMTCDFVGHPVISEERPNKLEIQKIASRNHIVSEKKYICLLPGSRKGEVKRMMPIFREVAHDLKSKLKDIEFIIPMGAGVVQSVRQETEKWSYKPKLIDPTDLSAKDAEFQKYGIFELCDLAIANSGTVALELAAANCPMLVAYKANWATTRMVKKMALIDTANLINIITETRIVPEFLFENCTAENIARSAKKFLSDPDLMSAQIAKCNEAIGALTPSNEDQGLFAAKSVLRALSRRVS